MWCYLWLRTGLFTAVNAVFICSSCLSEKDIFVLASGNRRDDDTGNLWVSENPGVPGNQTHPWPQMKAPQSLRCKSSPVEQFLFSALFYLRFLFLHFFLFSFPTLIFPAVDAWESTSLVLSNQACFATSNASPVVCWGGKIELIAGSFVLTISTWTVLPCVTTEGCPSMAYPIPCSRTLNGKLHGSVYSSAPWHKTTKRPHTRL